jgi:geranylgeranyl diphosphate synthase, type I
MNIAVSQSIQPRGCSRKYVDISALADAELEAVDALMRRLIAGDVVDRLSAMTLEQVVAKGRRVRARLALAASKAFGASTRESVAWAASVELLHNATLVHDDIQDGDRVRRGRPTVWAEHGVGQAINVGDFLLMLPYVALSEIRPDRRGDLALLLGETCTRIVRGQVQELSLLEAGRLDSASYLAAARGKTGALFELPVAGAALLGGRPLAEVAGYAALFGKVGLIFQLQDDVVDLFGDKGRGEVGSDIREGKVSALIVELARCHQELRGKLISILRKSRDETTVGDIEWVAHCCRETGALRNVLNTIDRIATEIAGDPLRGQRPDIGELAQSLTRLSLAPLESVRAALRQATLGQDGGAAE